MRNGKESNSCLFGEELVGYIYDELGATERAAFEKHLLDCNSCTAEFADVSVSRLGIYEWHRDEFLPLATPRITIPYQEPAQRFSLLDVLRGLIVSPLRIAFGGGTLAAVLLVLVLVSIRQLDDANIAVDASPMIPAEVVNTVVLQPQENVAVAAGNPEPRSVRREFKISAPERKFRAVEVKAVVPKKRPNVEASNAANAPRLANFNEPVDTTLRLSDLVADIDTKDIK